MSQFRVRTDLAVEARDYVMDQKEELRGIRVEEVKDEDICTTTVYIETKNASKTMGKPMGTYITIEAVRLEDEEERLGALEHIIRYGLNVARTEQYIEDRLKEIQTTEPQRRRTFILKDVRLFLNSIERGLKLVQEAGIAAVSGREDTEEEILLTIRIPKQKR